MRRIQGPRAGLLLLLAAVGAGCGGSGTTPQDDTTATDAADGNAPDTRTPVMPGPVPPDAAPEFDSATDAHVRTLVSAGRARGNRMDVFAKIGDSITESASFLFDVGDGWYQLGSYTSLQNTIAYFSQQQFDGRNPFNRPSVSAVAGWTADDALNGDGGGSPLESELDALQPQWALIMYGTNDLDHEDATTYRATMGRLLDIVEARSVVPVLYTIPPRQDAPDRGALAVTFADTIRAIAAERHLPLIEYNRALLAIPDTHGVSQDGIHPSIYTDPMTDSGDSAVFTPEALQFGYNVRNLLTLEMLARLQGYAGGT